LGGAGIGRLARFLLKTDYYSSVIAKQINQIFTVSPSFRNMAEVTLDHQVALLTGRVQGRLRGLRAVLVDFLPAGGSVSLQIGTHDLHQLNRLRSPAPRSSCAMEEHVKPDVIFQQLRHQPVHRTARSRDELQYVSALLALVERALHGVNLSAKAPHP
jgi:hypothetical protein